MVISLMGIIVGASLILLLIPMIFDYESAVAGTGPLTGGIIAFLVTSEGLKEMGMTSLVTISALILSLQSLFGMPLSQLRSIYRWLSKIFNYTSLMLFKNN
ncbi:hypothetical protein [Lysinibacillus sp. NPDC092081]|uniref:hypothetical protein n=1 Tax=Lysinibacillus sp. NPDC092081 TaxID=3364131 RepID=UPI0037FE8E9C